VLIVFGWFVFAADKIVRTLGEGTFGKVVECIDFSRSLSLCKFCILLREKDTVYILLYFQQIYSVLVICGMLLVK